MTLYFLRKKIQERKKRFDDPLYTQGYSNQDAVDLANERGIIELTWVDEQLRVFEQELSLRLAQLKKEERETENDWEIGNCAGRIDELVLLLGKKEETPDNNAYPASTRKELKE